MSSVVANGSLCGAAGSRAVCIFITGHREFPEQEINTSSLFMAAGRVCWWLMAAEFQLAFSLILAQSMLWEVRCYGWATSFIHSSS